MLDKWFKEDIDNLFKKQNIAVFIDESGESEFLLKALDSKYTVYNVDEVKVRKGLPELKELKVKYDLEKNNSPASRYLLYTRIPKEKLKFIREYCESNGNIEIKYLDNYIKQKVHNALNLNINLSKEELVSAAKVSFGKSQTYWMDLSHKGGSEIFDMEKELLPFLDSPARYVKDLDKTVKETFYKKVNELLGQDYIEKPPETLAKEVVETLLKGLVYNKVNKVLESVYKSWLDSTSKKSSFIDYLKKFNIPTDIDIWKVHPSHPFETIDEKWLKELGSILSEKTKLKEFTSRIEKRSRDYAAIALGINFWQDIKLLLEFDEAPINNLASFNDCIDYYTKTFYKVDRAIRNLYTRFLNKEKLLEPFQKLYRDISSVFLAKWFRYFEQYGQNQTGAIKKIIEDNNCRTAIIVGDGVAYEITMGIIEKVSRDFKVNKSGKNFMIADIPSETENNMSQLYVSTGEVFAVHKKREEFLSSELSSHDIGYIHLEEINEATDKHKYLICTYKDIDDMGEKLQQKALKFISEIEDVFAKKIEQLLRNKYQKVLLVTDHGFVLTGILKEEDKVKADNFTGDIKKAERYIRSVNKQDVNDFYYEVEKPYEDYKYLYFAKSINPFKTPGKYGFSHGGISPQELIIPFVCWENSEQQIGSLKVSVINKSDLASVTGDLFEIKIQAKAEQDDLFSQERKVIFVFFDKGKKVNQSDVITVKKDEVFKREYTLDGNKEVEIKILDAISKDHLDKVTVKQSNARDLGGLF